MDEVTKAKVRQITEMVSIYQSSMDGTDVESMKLVKMDLKNKEQELTAIQKSLDEELSKLYKNSSEIDPEINQLQREIQEIDNVLEDISDLLASAEQVNFEEKEEVLETKSEQFEYEEEKEIDEVEYIEDEEDEIEYIEDDEDKDEEIDEVEMIEDDEEEDEEIDEVEYIEDDEDEEEEIDEVEYENAEVSLTEPSEKYLKEAEMIVESRKQTIVDPEQAVENGAKTAEDLLDKLKKVVLVNEIEKNIKNQIQA